MIIHKQTQREPFYGTFCLLEKNNQNLDKTKKLTLLLKHFLKVSKLNVMFYRKTKQGHLKGKKSFFYIYKFYLS